MTKHMVFIMIMIFGVVLLFNLFPSADSLTQHDQLVLLRKHLLLNYTKEEVPVFNFSNPISIMIDFTLNTVINFDVITGKLTFSGYATLIWKDEYISWNPSQFGNISKVSVSVNDVWVPHLALANAADSIGMVFFDPSKENYNVEFTYNGQAMLITGGVLTSICTPTIQKYPFDDHTCPLNFFLFGMPASHVSITITDIINKRNVTENSVWDIEQADPYKANVPRLSYFVFGVVLKRKPLFILMNFILPVGLIVGISLWVFVLPPESGERISFATTMFLNMTVTMTAFADKLPPTSNPVAYLNIVMAIAVLISSLITFSTLVEINMFYKDGNKEKVPLFLSVLSSFVLRFPRRKQKINSDNSAEQQPENEDSRDINRPNIIEKYTSKQTHTVTSWKMVVKALDRICFWFFLVTAIITIVVYIATSLLPIA